MENNRKEQIEALKVLGDFQDKIIGNAGLLMNELKICRKPDTDTVKKCNRRRELGNEHIGKYAGFD